MNENETQPELVWFNGRWLLKSVVDRVTAEREAEKAEAKRVLLANVEGWRAATRAAKALEKAEKEKAPVSGPGNPSSPAQNPEPAKAILSGPPSLRSGVASPIKAGAKSSVEEERGEAILSDQIKAQAKSAAERESGEATPGNAGILAGESVYGGENSTPDPRPSVPISGQIKAEATSAPEKVCGEAPCQSDPSSPRSGVASQIKVEAKSAAEEERGEAVLSDQIKPNAENAERESGGATRRSGQIKVEAEDVPQQYSGGPNPQFQGRKGKIAGLPEEIREALNERLENGEEGKALLDWLNGLPEVKRFLAAEFEGAPILEQNLSAWRKGGYADWLERNAVVEVGLRLRENVAEWKEAGDLDLPQALGYWLTGQYALATRQMGDLQGDKKWALLWRVGRGVMRLRQVQEQGEKLKLAEARFAWKQEREAKRAEERAIVRALRAEEKAKRPRRREPTEEETEEAAQECREIFKPETEEDRAYYYKLRRDAEIADALARGEEPPPEPKPEAPSWTHVTKGRYF